MYYVLVFFLILGQGFDARLRVFELAPKTIEHLNMFSLVGIWYEMYSSRKMSQTRYCSHYHIGLLQPNRSSTVLRLQLNESYSLGKHQTTPNY
jgi:hypothetical protein